MRATLSKPFRPGQFFADMATAGVQFGISREEVVKKIVSAAEQHFAGIFFSFLLIYVFMYVFIYCMNSCIRSEWILDGSLDIYSRSRTQLPVCISR